MATGAPPGRERNEAERIEGMRDSRLLKRIALSTEAWSWVWPSSGTAKTAR